MNSSSGKAKVFLPHPYRFCRFKFSQSITDSDFGLFLELFKMCDKKCQGLAIFTVIFQDPVLKFFPKNVLPIVDAKLCSEFQMHLQRSN